jgi:hypothetical protein
LALAVLESVDGFAATWLRSAPSSLALAVLESVDVLAATSLAFAVLGSVDGLMCSSWPISRRASS